jgi:hypothetical protein
MQEVHHLERDDAARGVFACPIHDAHAAAPDFRFEREASEVARLAGGRAGEGAERGGAGGDSGIFGVVAGGECGVEQAQGADRWRAVSGGRQRSAAARAEVVGGGFQGNAGLFLRGRERRETDNAFLYYDFLVFLVSFGSKQ